MKESRAFKKYKRELAEEINDADREERVEMINEVLHRNERVFFLEDLDVKPCGSKNVEQACEEITPILLCRDIETAWYLLYGESVNRLPVSRAIYETMSFDEIEELEYYGGDESIYAYNEEKLANFEYASYYLLCTICGIVDT